MSTNPGKLWEPTPPSKELNLLIRTADIFCFDVDSTIIRSESIDELADYLGVGIEVRRITFAAMEGSMSYTEALKQRLDLMHPSEADIARFQVDHPPALSDGVRIMISGIMIAVCMY